MDIKKFIKDLGLSILLLGLSLISMEGANAQVLRDIFDNHAQEKNWNLRDDRPDEHLEDELSYENIVCGDKNTFPKPVAEIFFRSFFECKMDLDRIEDASYIDLTYRIRWDGDRLDLYLPSGPREIYICDGKKLTKYEHDQRKDPDWWMISRTSPEIANCPIEEITVEPLGN